MLAEGKGCDVKLCLCGGPSWAVSTLHYSRIQPRSNSCSCGFCLTPQTTTWIVVSKSDQKQWHLKKNEISLCPGCFVYSISLFSEDATSHTNEYSLAGLLLNPNGQVLAGWHGPLADAVTAPSGPKNIFLCWLAFKMCCVFWLNTVLYVHISNASLFMER